MEYFLSEKSDGKMIFTDYWKVLVLNFRWCEIRSFLSQEIDGKMTFTWSFATFHDTPGLGKYSFSCSGTRDFGNSLYMRTNFEAISEEQIM